MNESSVTIGRLRNDLSGLRAPETPTPSFVEALRFWVRLGFISFGGPAGQIAIMHRELVERRRWISEERFLHALNFCMMLPGPEAQQLATYVGWLLHGARGGIVAGALFVLPSAFILLCLSYIFVAYGDVPAVVGVLSGFKPVVVAIVFEAVLRIGRRTLTSRAHIMIAVGAFLAVLVLEVPFPMLVLGAAVAGLVMVKSRSSELGITRAVPRLEDQMPSRFSTPLTGSDLAPQQTVPSIRRIFRTLAVGLLLWIVPLISLAVWRGWDSLHVAEYSFFTRAALVTFGGAYAVLPYVSQAAVGSYAWLTQAQMMDGLALAETTPGPLIMVLQFVGFMGGWNHPEGMSPLLSALTGAVVTTYATFLPCFLFIFLGAPYVEVLRDSGHLRGALSGVTASVVGVVLHLALVFGTAVIWPTGLSGGSDWFAILLSITSFCVLVFLRSDVVWVILAGGLAGLARALAS